MGRDERRSSGGGPQAPVRGRGLIFSAQQIQAKATLIGSGTCVGKERNELFSMMEKDNASIC